VTNLPSSYEGSAVPAGAAPILDVIVPARNEAARLPRTLAALRAGLADLNVASVVTVVDNASTDDTAELVLSQPDGPVPVRLLRCEAPGKGNAVKAGVAASNATYVGFCDADLATSLDGLPEILNMLKDGAGVVIGSRALAASVVQARHSVARELGAAFFRWTVQRVVPSVDDTQCGYKFFDGDLARRIFPHVACGGFAFDVEVLARAQHAGYGIVETPVNWVDVPGSSFSPVRDGLRSFLDVVGIGRRVRKEERQMGRLLGRLSEGDEPEAAPLRTSVHVLRSSAGV
jgi:dolichyl-phosphate beta-glucosyltransferase